MRRMLLLGTMTAALIAGLGTTAAQAEPAASLSPYGTCISAGIWSPTYVYRGADDFLGPGNDLALEKSNANGGNVNYASIRSGGNSRFNGTISCTGADGGGLPPDLLRPGNAQP